MNKLLINTPQNVKFEYNLASVGSRLIAFAIDYALIILYWIGVVLIISKSSILNFKDDWAQFGVFSLVSLPALMYPLFAETFMHGQTIGKRIMKLKVVKIDGTRATFYQYFIRWISNTIDIFLGAGALGLTSIILTQKSQRIGDIAADTTVISVKPNVYLQQTLFKEITKDHTTTYSEVIKLTDKDVNEINDIYTAAYRRKNYQIIIALATRLEQLLGIKSQHERPEDFIVIVMQDHYYMFRDK